MSLLFGELSPILFENSPPQNQPFSPTLVLAEMQSYHLRLKNQKSIIRQNVITPSPPRPPLPQAWQRQRPQPPSSLRFAQNGPSSSFFSLSQLSIYHLYSQLLLKKIS